MLKARDMLPTPSLRDLISWINARIVYGCRQLTRAPYTPCEVISISCASVWQSVLIGSRIDKRIRHATRHESRRATRDRPVAAEKLRFALPARSFEVRRGEAETAQS